MTVTQDTLVERVARAIHDVRGGIGYDYMDFCRDAARAAIAVIPDAARIEQLEATLARQSEAAGKLAEALDTIANGAELGEQLFDARMGEHKDRLTWHAVNVLQDNIAACVGHARTALQAWETRHDL